MRATHYTQKTQRPLNLFGVQAVYAPTYVPAGLARDLSWGYSRYCQLKNSGVQARLVRPRNQGPVVVYQQTALVQ